MYCNADCIDLLIEELLTVLEQISPLFEIILVDDGSPDDVWFHIMKKAAHDARLRGIRFTRNFGQHLAITAGIDYCRGEWVVVMDGDFQDLPGAIPALFAKAQSGFDVVFARRRHRKDSSFKRRSSAWFYRLFNYLADSDMDPAVANFGIYSRRVIEQFRTMRERSRLFPLFIRWLGFRTAFVDVEHGKRGAGKTAYTLRKRLRLGLDTILSMSNKPLKLAVKTGFIIAFLAFVFGIVEIVRYLVWGIPVAGWTSMIVSLYFIGGLLLAMLGILGLYIGRMYDEVKKRPLYVVAEVTAAPRT